MPTPIGHKVHTKFKKEETKDVLVSQFSVLQFVAENPSHVIKAEVALFDDEDECIGPARWIRINPLMDGEKEIDNWEKLQKNTLAQIPELVKAALQKWGM